MTRKHTRLGFLRHEPVTLTKYDQTGKSTGQSNSSLAAKSTQNWKGTVTKPCLKKKNDAPSHSGPSFIKDITPGGCLTKENDIQCLRASPLKGQTENNCSYRPLNSSEALEDEPLVDSKRESERTLSYKSASCSDVTITTHDIILANAKRRVTFSEDSKPCCHGDQMFSDSRGGNAKLLTPENVCTEQSSCALTLVKDDSYFMAALRAPDSDQADGSDDQHSSCPLHPPDVYNNKSVDAAGCTLSGSSAAVTQVCCHALLVPLRVPRKNLRAYQVVPLFGNMEKLTRRQMVQLAAMMGLGFVFVILILVWLFSPVLF